MFITQPLAEQAMPPALTEPGERFWRAVSLSIEAPWFLFVYEADIDGVRMKETVLIAWETDLISVMESVPIEKRMAAARISISTSNSYRWTVQWIDSVWVKTSINKETKELFFKFEGEVVLRDVHLNEVSREGVGYLLFQVK